MPVPLASRLRVRSVSPLPPLFAAVLELAGVDLFAALALDPCFDERPPPPLTDVFVSFLGPLTGLTTEPVLPPAPPPADAPVPPDDH